MKKLFITFIVSCFSLLFTSCDKSIEGEMDKIINNGNLKLSIPVDLKTKTKAHWNDRNLNGDAFFEWDLKIGDDAEVLSAIMSNDNSIIQWEDNKYYAVTDATPMDAINYAKLLTQTSINITQNINLGNKVFFFSPIKTDNNAYGATVTTNTSSNLLVTMEMPNKFSKSTLKDYTEYSYIYGESTIEAKIKNKIKPNNDTLFAKLTTFNPIVAAIRLKITNGTDNDMNVVRVTMRAVDKAASTEAKLFPNKLEWKVNGGNATFGETTDKTGYYSTIASEINTTIATNNSTYGYMFVLPMDNINAFAGKDLVFTITTKQGDYWFYQYSIATKSLNLSNRSDEPTNENRFSPGGIYTFDLDVTQNLTPGDFKHPAFYMAPYNVGVNDNIFAIDNNTNTSGYYTFNSAVQKFNNSITMDDGKKYHLPSEKELAGVFPSKQFFGSNNIIDETVEVQGNTKIYKASYDASSSNIPKVIYALKMMKHPTSGSNYASDNIMMCAYKYHIINVGGSGISTTAKIECQVRYLGNNSIISDINQVNKEEFWAKNDEFDIRVQIPLCGYTMSNLEGYYDNVKSSLKQEGKVGYYWSSASSSGSYAWSLLTGITTVEQNDFVDKTQGHTIRLFLDPGQI